VPADDGGKCIGALALAFEQRGDQPGAEIEREGAGVAVKQQAAVRPARDEAAQVAVKRHLAMCAAEIDAESARSATVHEQRVPIFFLGCIGDEFDRAGGDGAVVAERLHGERSGIEQRHVGLCRPVDVAEEARITGLADMNVRAPAMCHRRASQRPAAATSFREVSGPVDA
jgi:hypothetical protein